MAKKRLVGELVVPQDRQRNPGGPAAAEFYSAGPPITVEIKRPKGAPIDPFSLWADAMFVYLALRIRGEKDTAARNIIEQLFSQPVLQKLTRRKHRAVFLNRLTLPPTAQGGDELVLAKDFFRYAKDNERLIAQSALAAIRKHGLREKARENGITSLPSDDDLLTV